MSKASATGAPSARATSAAATTPPAGPDSTVRDAWEAASPRGSRPPFDCMMPGAGRPATRARRPSAPRYSASTGVRYASSTVVAIRSYSRISGSTSDDTDT